jgi:hypothetical protein
MAQPIYRCYSLLSRCRTAYKFYIPNLFLEYVCCIILFLSLRGHGIVQPTTLVVVSVYSSGVNRSYENKFSLTRREMYFVAKCKPTFRVGSDYISHRSLLLTSVGTVYMHCPTCPPHHTLQLFVILLCLSVLYM